jgi:hypothetical protein
MPFLISDSYPASATQPVKFVVTVDAATPVEIDPSVDAGGLKFLKFDLTPLPVGQHSIVVKSKNEWGVSPNSSPFVFAKSIPNAPANLSIIF